VNNAILIRNPIRTGLEATRRWPYTAQTENPPSFGASDATYQPVGWFSDDTPPPQPQEGLDWKALVIVALLMVVVIMFVGKKDAQPSYRRY
jgi:hypothetical protein